METRKSTTAGIVFWTPAPARTSPTSSVISEDVWDDEDEEQAEKDDDFVSQMDENGIIGLSEALEGVEFGEAYGDANAGRSPNLYPGPLNPEEADISGHERDTPPEELSYNLTEHLSHTESPGQDVQMQSQYDDFTGSLTAWTVDEEVKQGIGCFPETDKYLDMTEEEKDEKKAGKRSDRMRNKNEPSCTSRELGTRNGLTESYTSKGETEKMSSTPSCSAHPLAMEPAAVSSHHCQKSQPASPAPTFPHLLHFTAEEMAAAPGIEAETFPEMSFIESLSESHKSPISFKPSPRCPEIKPRASLQPATMFSEEVMSNHYCGVSNGPLKGSDKSDKQHKRPTPSPRTMKQHSPMYSACSPKTAGSLKCKHETTSPDRDPRTRRAKNNAAEVDESRKGPLNYRTPDFSKVEPRVRIPKDGYKPPKSRRSFKRDSLSPEPPLVFKSPADIVKEVLLNITDGSPAPSDSRSPPASAPDFTVPQEFRCPRHATTLLEQLQEDYNTLLTKYAEAENTIDRLRLEAKVNLYSDPSKPGYLVQSGLNQEASRVMMLDFPQAQRADINTASSHQNGRSTPQRSPSACPSTRSPGPQVGQQLAQILYNQADKFLQQLQTFEDLLKGRKLQPSQQVKGISQLAEGLDSLERGYLLARDEHKLQLQRGTEIDHFDPERELEGLIFQCGLRMEELKEQVEQMRQEQPTCEAPPSPPPHPTPLSVPPERGETPAHPQSPPVPLLVDPGETVAVEVSSASEESDKEMENEETLNSFFLKPLNDKHRRVEQDFATLTDHYQSFEELPKRLDHHQRNGAPLPSAVRTNMQSVDKDKERQSQETGNLEVQKSLPQRKSDQHDSPPVHTEQRTSRSIPPSRRASSQPTTLPVDPPSSRRKLEVGKSHSSSLSSLGEITATERRNSKLQTGSCRVLSQDGIISPETDSGFVGSESSRLTPAAAPSPLHQRASESVSVSQKGNPRKPQTGPVSAFSPASSPLHSPMAVEPSGGSQLTPDQPRRTRQRQRRRTFSCSPRRWVAHSEQSRADSGTTHIGSEDGQNDPHTESINSSLHSSSTSSSPTARHRHGDSLRALSSSQVANRNVAIQTLQAEVTRLRERIQSCLRHKKPQSSVRATPSAKESYTHPSTSTPHMRSGERGRERQAVDEAEDFTLRRTTRKRPPSSHRQKPQPEILTASEPSPLQPPPLVSRCTQTATPAPDSCCSHTNTCVSHHRGQREGPVDGNREPTHSSHRPYCGCPELYRSTEPDCRRVSGFATHTSRQPAESPDRAARSRHFTAAAPPTLLQCMPVCPPPLVLYPSPIYMSPSNSAGTSSGVRGRREVRGRPRRSLSVDKQRSVDSSLDRAIRAARNMKHTSGHMARSLAAGLHYQEQLTQSCSY
ncbi:uncharacterized protein akna [Symphorus nematophorus]